MRINLGRDFRRGGQDFSRGSAALEWTPLPAWSFLAERYQERDKNF